MLRVAADDSSLLFAARDMLCRCRASALRAAASARYCCQRADYADARF